MSTLQVSNISDGTTTVGTEYVVNGSAKAWVNFNGTGTVAIRESLNVGSITDNGVGDYTVTFSSALTDANYFAAGISGNANNTGDASDSNLRSKVVAASSMRFSNKRTGIAGKDDIYVSLAAIR